MWEDNMFEFREYKDLKLGQGRFDSHSERMAYIDGFKAAEEFLKNQVATIPEVDILTKDDLFEIAVFKGVEEYIDYLDRVGTATNTPTKKELKGVIGKKAYAKYKKLIKERESHGIYFK